MADATVRLKRSSTAGEVPTAASLQQGELAVNLVDHILYTKDSTNAVVPLTGSTSGAGGRTEFEVQSAAGVVAGAVCTIAAPGIAGDPPEAAPANHALLAAPDAIGVSPAAIAAAGVGKLIVHGPCPYDTSAWSVGDVLYVNPATPGALQNTLPSNPTTEKTQPIALVTKINTGTDGEIFVNHPEVVKSWIEGGLGTWV